MKNFSRRQFVRGAAVVGLGFAGLRQLLMPNSSALSVESQTVQGYGALVPDPEKILDLPSKFSYHVISRAGERMDDGFYVPGKHDGMAAFAGPDGKTILVRNHELEPQQLEYSPFGANNELFEKLNRAKVYDLGKGNRPGLGGTTTLVYDTRARRLERHFLSLAGTHRNCAGGPTPWNTWVTCEETSVVASGNVAQDHGYNFEVPATADLSLADPVPLKAMGRFRHEAIAVHPNSGVVYQTEDQSDGLIYRFIPNRPGELPAGGKLQALKVRGSHGLDTRNWRQQHVAVGESLDVEWVDVRDVESPEDDLRYQGRFEKGAARFARGEGMWYGREAVYFACTNGGRLQKGQIWKYTPSPEEGRPAESNNPGKLELFIEPNDSTLVENADNLTVAPWGDLVVCEDGPGFQYVVGVTPEGKIYQIGRTTVSELAGATFSPDGSTLFVNVQTPGWTLAIRGPWQLRRG